MFLEALHDLTDEVNMKLEAENEEVTVSSYRSQNMGINADSNGSGLKIEPGESLFLYY